MKVRDNIIHFRSSYKSFSIPATEVIGIKGLSSYILLYTDKKRYPILQPMHAVEKLLKDYSFVRCHKSHIVNMLHISKEKHQSGVVLEGGVIIPIGRTYRKDFERKVREYRKRG